MLFENTAVCNFEGALRGMRNPMDSWDKSDSIYYGGHPLCIGDNDMKLAKALIRGGSEHRKFLRQIQVCVDITAPLYWWSEFDTYKIGTTANSCSTMHKLHAYPITEDMFTVDSDNWSSMDWMYWENTLHYLEDLRLNVVHFRDKKDPRAIDEFRKLKQALPTSFNQKRTVTLNYETIRTMCSQRKNHRLYEWSIDFIEWARTLPYADDFIFYNENQGGQTNV